MYARHGKRLLDFLLGAMLSLLLVPLLVVVAVVVACAMGRPVIFRQLRTGRNGRNFTLYKFRTMTGACDVDGKLRSDRERLTWLGRMLRASSLDELPQLWNLVRGDVSLVGPRPLLPEYWDRYTTEQRRRHVVRPGMTGLAQVSGRQSLPFSKRFQLDNWYVDNLGLWVDLKIIAASVVVVISRRDVKHGQDVREVDDVGLHELTWREKQGTKGSGQHDHLPGTDRLKAA
ncbi:MAG: hypothetical protein CMJ81_04515 [Planctomycetaceae bacterium]|nr:hypothetical protein [Planctomycetaceae bacterium]MBP60399.1 hypothetical protein [Planctomycetaceae bacterium]